MAQTIPQVNNVPWYQFNRKLSVGERFQIPLDTLSMPAGATVRDTSGLLAIKGTTLYFLYNGTWINVSSASATIDSSIYATVYRVDTATNSIRGEIAGKVDIADTSAMLGAYFNQAIRSGDSIIFYNSGVRLAGVYAPPSLAANGLSKSGDTTQLGGQMNKNVTIDGNGYNFLLYNANNSTIIGTTATIGGRTFTDLGNGISGDTGFVRLKKPWQPGVVGSPLITTNNSANAFLLNTGGGTFTFTNIGTHAASVTRAMTHAYVLNLNSGTDWAIVGDAEDSDGTALTTMPKGFSIFAYSGTGTRWIRLGSGSSGGSSGVTSVATNDATGITGGPITTTGTLAIDTNLLKTHASHKKAIDSLGALIGAGGLDTSAAAFKTYVSNQRKDTLNTTSLTAFGDSFTQSQGATSSAFGYINMLANDFGLTVNNQSVSARGVWEMGKRANEDATVANNNTAIITSLAGLNDVRRNGSNTKTINKIKNAHRSLIVNAFKKSYTVSTAATGANWSSGFTAISVGGKSNSAQFTTTNGGYKEHTFTGTMIGVQLIGNSGDVDTYSSSVQISIDGTPIDTVDLNNQWDNVSDGSNDNRRGPVMLFYSGLSNASHTIRVTNLTANIAVLDCFFELNQTEKVSPVVVGLIPYLTTAGYAVAPASGTVANTDIANSAIIEVVNEFASIGFPVSYATTNTFYSTTTGISVDDIHPNNVGHSQIRNAFRQPLLSAYRGLPIATSTVSSGGGGSPTTPGGSTTQFQFNNAGSFAGAANVKYDNTNNRLMLGGISSATYDVELERSVAGDLFIANKNTSTTGRTAFYARNNSNSPLMMGVTGSAYAGYGALSTGTPFIYASGNLTFMADNSNRIIFATGASPATEKARFEPTGNLLMGTTTDVATSILTMTSTTKGMLPPRMTQTQRDAISVSGTNAGLMLYNTTSGTYDYTNGSVWIQMGNGILTTTTTNATPTALTYTITDETSGILEISIIGKETGGTGAITAKKIVRYRKDGGTLTLGTPTTLLADEIDAAIAAATYNITTSANNVSVSVTGIASTTINWRIDIKDANR